MNDKKDIFVSVKGMHCASCASVIEKTLLKQEGVISCSVNYATEKLKVEYDQSKVQLKDLSKKIEPLGYSLNIQESAEHTMSDGSIMDGMDHSQHLGLNQSKQDKLAELANLRRKVITVIPLVNFTFIRYIYIIVGWCYLFRRCS